MVPAPPGDADKLGATEVPPALSSDDLRRGTAFHATGRVQGVAYRWFARDAATELGVTGWIRNRADGDVEGEAFGEPAAVERFLDRLREGPPRARVESLRSRPATGAGPTAGFEIRA